MDTADEIPPSLPIRNGGISPLCKRGVRGDFGRIGLVHYRLLSNLSLRQKLSPLEEGGLSLSFPQTSPLPYKVLGVHFEAIPDTEFG